MRRYLPFAFDDLYGCEGSLAIVVSPLKALMKDQVDRAIVIICINTASFFPKVASLSSKRLLQLMPLARRTYPSKRKMRIPITLHQSRTAFNKSDMERDDSNACAYEQVDLFRGSITRRIIALHY